MKISTRGQRTAMVDRSLRTQAILFPSILPSLMNGTKLSYSRRLKE